MFILGTAGHVDHGKSALVRALTGIDPDRLREEKEREMTIDLGFAWLALPSGREVSIVDVPGHEHFVRNMLAGVGAIDVALLVVAANEGIMPQTREHLAILDLLRVSSGLVAITKRDLVDEELLELVTMEVRELIAGTSLAQASVVAVSAHSREGLPDLVREIDNVLDSASPKRDAGRPRMAIDRAFIMKGFGSVVTGSLIDGALSVGQEVEIVPAGIRARVRGLEMHKRRVEVATPGSRVGVNLAAVPAEELERGYVLATPGWLRPTRCLDVRLRLLPHLPRPLGHNATVSFYTGTSEVGARVRLLDSDRLEPGQWGWAQVICARPVVAVRGDLFICRTTADTIGGGEIVDPYARRHRRYRDHVLASLQALGQGDAAAVVLAVLETRQPVEQGRLPSLCQLSAREVEDAMAGLAAQGRVVSLGDRGPHSMTLSSEGWERLAGRVQQAVASYHRQHPLRQGMPRGELKGRLAPLGEAWGDAIRRLVQDGVLVEEGQAVRLPSHEVRLTPQQQERVDAFLASLAETPYSPPPADTLTPDLVAMLVQRGQVMDVGGGILFAAPVYEEMVRRITGHIAEHGKITVAEVRDLFGTSRKYALAVMEHLDSARITRRIGDERVLR